MADVTGMTPARIAQEITNKVGVLQSNVASELSKKANTTYVDSELSEKANTTDVASELSKKASTTYVNTELSKKANTTYVNTELSKKAYITYVDNGLSKKADTTYVDSGLSKKASTTYVDSGLSKKVDEAYVSDRLRPTMLDDVTSLNTLTSIGTYAQQTSSTDDSRYALGYPALGSGMLEVLNPFLNGTHGLTVQRYTTYAGISYWRAKASSVWGEWQQVLATGSVYTKSEIDTLLENIEPPEPVTSGVQSDTIERIVVSDDASSPTNTGDLLLVYDKPLSRFTHVFDTDFTSRWSSASWNLYTTAEVSPTTNGKFALSYDAIGTPVDVELVTRMTSTNHAGAGHGLIARADENNGYYAWVGNGKVNLNGWDNGTFFGILSKTLPFTISDNDWIWLRFRIFGSTLAAKVWLDGQAEPADWDVTTRHTRVTSPGWAGVNTNRSGKHIWDLLGAAIDGAAAPKS